MGRVLLVCRLAARDMRRRPVEAALLLLAITGAATTLTLGLALHGVTSKAYERTREATSGPDVVASVGPPPTGLKADLATLADAPGVARHSGPYPVVPVLLEAGGRTVVSQVQGRDNTAAAVDQPKPTDGGWIRVGGVVLEATFAASLGVGRGDRITLKPVDLEERDGHPVPVAHGPGRSFQVAGLAVTASTPPYPEPACFALCIGDAGLVWLTQADVLGLDPREESHSYVLNLKLDDPQAAPAFAAARNPRPGVETRVAPTDPLPPILHDWQQTRAASGGLVRNQRRALLTGAWLLALLAVASVAVLVGGRMADQTRRVGLLKAVGGTPGLVAAVLLAEYVVVAVLAAATGLAIGWLAAPLLTDAGAQLLGSADTRTLSLSTVALVTAVALCVAVAATFVPAVRAARTSTVRALAGSARGPQRSRRLIAISARLPVALLLGLRIAGRRPRRIVLAFLSIAITTSGLVAALSAHAGVEAGAEGTEAALLNRVLLVITITLVSLAAVNTIFITWATALDGRRVSALARALGATPDQVTLGLSAAQLLPALAGALVGIPGGLALVAAVDPDQTVNPPLWQLIAVVPGTVLVVAALTAIPARIGARQPAAEVLRSELA